MAQQVARLLSVVARHRGAMPELMEIGQVEVTALDAPRHAGAVGVHDERSPCPSCSNNSGKVGRPSASRARC
jgi:hypothetical protein